MAALSTAVIYTVILSVSIIFVNCHLPDDNDAKAKLEKYIQEQKKLVDPRYRLLYHVAAPVGWINDPNGFSFYKGEYHLFYQYYPYDSVWGPMHWGHVKSQNLVEWEYLPTALLPGDEECYSGSAAVEGENMTLMYTGHKILSNNTYNETQYLAVSEDGVTFRKIQDNPVISSAPAENDGYVASDFRDPKMWRHGDYWYVVIGSKTSDDRGRVLLYRFNDLRKWNFLTVLAESTGNMGYMWECPDFFELDGKFILLISPQGMKSEDEGNENTVQTGYFVGSFSYDTHKFTPSGGFQLLDFGHDFYAAQTQEVNGRRVLVAWFKMWEVPYPEVEDKWAGAMTVVRELHLSSFGRLLMLPVKELDSLRSIYKNGDFFKSDILEGFGSTLDLEIVAEPDKHVSLLFEGVKGGGSINLIWNNTRSVVIVDRGARDIRQASWAVTEELRWRILLDTSTLELFCGKGEVVFSSRVYPLGGWRVINQGSNLRIWSNTLKRSVPK